MLNVKESKTKKRNEIELMEVVKVDVDILWCNSARRKTSIHMTTFYDVDRGIAGKRDGSKKQEGKTIKKYLLYVAKYPNYSGFEKMAGDIM